MDDHTYNRLLDSPTEAAARVEPVSGRSRRTGGRPSRPATARGLGVHPRMAGESRDLRPAGKEQP
jgi:hypothetical protein